MSTVKKKMKMQRKSQKRHGYKINSITSTLAILLITLFVIIIVNSLKYDQYSTGMTGASTDYEIGKVITVVQESLTDSIHQTGIMVGTQTLKLELLTGKHKGETVTVTNSLSTYNSIVAKSGQKLVVIVDSLDSGRFQVLVYNYYRAPYIYLLGFVFFIALVLVGGKKGMMSGFSLIYTFICVFLVFLPLIVRGFSPVWAAIALVVMVTTATMIFINGLGQKSLCAILGTTCGVVLSGVILFVFGKIMHLSGYNTEEAESLLLISQTTGLMVKDLLFAGILIASLGAVMDTAISIVSSMNEIHSSRPGLKGFELFKAGMNVGKDMIGSMSNTLILAFTGTALNMIILLYSYSVQYNQLLNMNLIAIEIVQMLAGSLGIILTVPLTAAITAEVFVKRK